MSRALFAAAALLASVTLARAEGQATFSPDLKDTPPAANVPPPSPAAAVEPPAKRGRPARRTRLARAPKPTALARAPKPSLAAPLSPASAAESSAPLPPLREDTKVAEAVGGAPAAEAAAPVKARSGTVEAAARTPGPSAATGQGGQHEEASGTVAQLLAKHAQANGVPLKLAQAVVTIESRGNVRASNHGALGLMQIKYGTARAAGFGGAALGLLVADTNLRYGMKVLGEAYKAAGGDTCGALMRYQSGHLSTHMSAANRAYCSRARALMAGA